MIRQLITVLSVGFSLLAEAQALKVEMRLYKDWHGTYPSAISQMQPSLQPETYALPKNLPQPYLIKEYDFNYRQDIFKKYLIDSSSLTDWERDIVSENPGYLSKAVSTKSVVALLIYEKGTQRYFTLDANFNKDFTDDSIYAFPRNELQKVDKPYWRNYLIRKQLEVEDFRDGKPIKIHPFITVYPFSSKNLTVNYPDSLSRRFPVMGISWDYAYRGTVAENLHLWTETRTALPLFTKSNAVFYVEDEKKIRSFPYRVGAVFENKGEKYKIDSVAENGEHVYLKMVSPAAKLPGIFPGFYVDALKGESFAGDTVSVAFPQNKDVLLDFWGTWCVPCLELTPQVKALHAAYQDRVNFISVAVDDSIQKASEYVKNKDLRWTHFAESMSGAKLYSTAAQFSVGSFPNFILIDKSGKILFRDSGTTGFAKLKSYLAGTMQKPATAR